MALATTSEPSAVDRHAVVLGLVPGIRRMGPGSGTRVLEFGVFDKTEPSRRAPPERGMALGQSCLS